MRQLLLFSQSPQRRLQQLLPRVIAPVAMAVAVAVAVAVARVGWATLQPEQRQVKGKADNEGVAAPQPLQGGARRAAEAEADPEAMMVLQRM